MMGRLVRRSGGARRALFVAAAASGAAAAPAGAIDVVPTSDLEIGVRAADPAAGPVLFGGTVSYEITLRTLGNVPVEAYAITVADRGVGLVSIGGDADLDALLDPGEVWRYAAPSGPVTLPADTCAPVVNTATVSLATDPGSHVKHGTDPNPANDTSTVETPVECRADLAVRIATGPADPAPGQTVTSTVTVTNNGPVSVPSYKLGVGEAHVPLTLTSPEPPGRMLAPGASMTFTGTRTVGPGDCGKPVTTSATIRLLESPLTDPNPANDAHESRVVVSCRVTGTSTVGDDPGDPARPDTSPGLRIAAGWAPRTAVAGGAARLAVVVRNTGRVALRDLVVRGPLPPGASLLGARPAGVLRARLVTWPIARLAPGSARVIRVRMRLPRRAAATCTVATVRAGLLTARDRACVRVRLPAVRTTRP